jgi:hypothetical protein
MRHKRRVRKNLRQINRYYGVSVSKHPKKVTKSDYCIPRQAILRLPW